MKYSLPPDEPTLFETLKHVNGGGGGGDDSLSSDIRTVLAGLIRGLSSPTRAQGFYVAFVTTLKLGSVSTTEIINLIDTALTSPSSGATKREKTYLARARALALGGLVRSGKLNQQDQLNSVLKELASYCERKGSLSVLAIPFVLALLESGNGHLSLEPIEVLMAKKMKNSSQLQIALKIQDLGLELKSDYLESMDNIIDTLLMYVQPDDSATLQLLFKYLDSANSLEDFWTALAARLKRTHLSLLVGCIHAAILKQCPGAHFLSHEIIVYLLKTFLKEDPEGCQKAKEGFGLLLNWAPPEESGTPTAKSNTFVTLTKKERKRLLKHLFEGVPNLLHEYKYLKPQLQRLISCLSGKEIDEIVKCMEAGQDGAAGDRLQITAQHFRSLIVASKNASLSCKSGIVEAMFKTGFCRQGDAVAPMGLDTAVEKMVQNTFSNLLGLSLDEEVVSQLFGAVLAIVTGADQEWRLTSPVGEEMRKLWKRVAKLTKESAATGAAKKCLKLHLIVDLIKSKPGYTNDDVETLIEICKGESSDDEDEIPNERLAEFILNKMLAEYDVILDYDAMLKSLFQDQNLIAKNLGVVTEVIDPDEDDEDMDQLEEEDDSSNEGDSQDSDSDVDEGPDFSKILQKLKAANETKANGQDSDSDIDMDDATEEDLLRTDNALANVFSTQKKIKHSSQLELARFMRACKILDLILRTVRLPDATLIPLILPPCLSSLVKCSKNLGAGGDKGQIAREKVARINKIVGRLLKVRKLQNLDAVEEEIVKGMIQDIEKYRQGKLAKQTRRIMIGATSMLIKCFQLEEKPDPKSLTPKRKRKSKNAITPEKQKSVSQPADKKRRQSAPAIENGVAATPAKKKRKSTVT